MKFVAKIAVAVTALAMLATPALAEKTVKWKLAMTWPSTLTPLASPPIKLAKMVEEMSGGKFIIKVEGKEKHKAPLGILDWSRAVSTRWGTADPITGKVKT